MTLPELYAWAAERSTLIFAGACALPLVGTAAAWVGKKGKSDRDGRLIADALLVLSLLLVAAEVIGLVVADSAHGAGSREWLLEADALLLLAPIACLGLSLLGIRLVFPLGELASVKRLTSLGAFLAALAAAVWLLGRFRWGVLFYAHFVWLLALSAIAVLVMWSLWRKAAGAPTR